MVNSEPDERDWLLDLMLAVAPLLWPVAMLSILLAFMFGILHGLERV